MAKIKDLNPVPQFDIGGTDLAIPARLPDGRIGFGFGDTYAGPRPSLGGPNWRSPVLLFSDTHDVSKPIEFNGAARGGRQLVDYVHDNPEFSTILPCDFISIGNRIYLWVMYTQGLGNERYCKIWTSDDMGEHWDTSGPRWSTSAFGGKRTMVTWDKGGDGFVYIISTGGLARNKNAILHRCPEGSLTNPAAWQPWGWDGRGWAWGNDPGADPTRGILPDNTRLGEICLRNIQGNWVFSGFDDGAYNAFVKVAARTTDNWHTAPDYRPLSGQDVPQLYGCYIHPDSRFDGTFCMIVSQWNTSAGTPYRAMQYLIDGIKPVVPILNQEQDDMTTPGTTPEKVLAAVEGTTTNYDENRPGAATKPDLNLFGAVKRALFELTLWTPLASGTQLRDRAEGYVETTHGHARDAASWGKVNGAKLDTIIKNQERIIALLEGKE